MNTLTNLAQTSLARAATTSYPGVYLTAQPAVTKTIPGVDTQPPAVLRTPTAPLLTEFLHTDLATQAKSPIGNLIGQSTIADASKYLQKIKYTPSDIFGKKAAIDVSAKYKLIPEFAGPPILGSFQAQRATDAYNKLDPEDRAAFDTAINQAASNDERDYLRKALAANHDVPEIVKFAADIRGKGSAWLEQNLRLTGNGNGDRGMTQQWNDSCGPTVALVLRGEMDPIFSLNVRRANADITKVDPRPDATIWDQIFGPMVGKPPGNASTATQQAQILEDLGGGVAVQRGQAGGKGMNFEVAFDSQTSWTGVNYVRHNVTTDAQRTSALNTLDADLAAGIPGALRISSNDTNGGGHAVAVTGIIDGPPKKYVLHDPWDGKTVYVKASDLEKGNIIPSIAGWTHLTDVYSSK